MPRIVLLGAIIAIGFVTLPRALRSRDPLAVFPPVVLWSWEHPDDLRFVNPKVAGVAFLAKTLWLSRDGVVSRPRLSKLQYSPGTALMAVVRFESAGDGLPESSTVVPEVVRTAGLSGIRALQIDFDARESERAWYAAFLRALRDALPASLPLTMTALVSWCDEDDWIARLPVEDACPMWFRMGTRPAPAPHAFDAGLCRASVGVSTDELPARIPSHQRLFIFHPSAWTIQSYEAAIAQARRWR